ncbi:hypothetical protein [Bdellovibrio sp.]|uniref:hypothetical protein n=1 Tax=Bdellovibrio sp. TaxID=28201 RepID=UPI0032216BE9
METARINTLLGDLISFKIVTITPNVEIPKGIPHLVLKSYRLTTANIQGLAFILAEAASDEVEIKKILLHQDILKKAAAKPVMFIFNELKSYQQKALMGHKVNYVDMRGNIFLPDALLAVRAANEKAAAFPAKLSLRGKAAIIRYLVVGDIQGKTVSDFADFFAISKVHASRLVEELRTFELIKINREGVSKHVHFLPKRELWNQAKGLLGSPVIARIYLNRKTFGAKLAGYSALGHLTMLDGGMVQTQAIGKKDFSKIEAQLKAVPKELAQYCLEVWEWDPNAISEGSTVDPISLYLSMQDSHDDRTQIALKELLKTVLGD